MENVSRAFIMAFSMLIFVIAFSYSMYMINKLTTTSNTLLQTVSTTNYYDNVKVQASDITKRDVGIDTIIPTLYRYYKESYSVKIIVKGNDGKDELLQLFDVKLESQIAKAAAYTGSQGSPSFDKELYSLKNSIYNTDENKAYLFKAPWTGSTDENIRARIDYFLNGTKGYINNAEVDYSTSGPAFKNQEGGFIAYCKKTDGTDRVFEESFVEYAYEGQTISTENRIGNNHRKCKRKFKNYHNI